MRLFLRLNCRQLWHYNFFRVCRSFILSGSCWLCLRLRWSNLIFWQVFEEDWFLHLDDGCDFRLFVAITTEGLIPRHECESTCCLRLSVELNVQIVKATCSIGLPYANIIHRCEADQALSFQERDLCIKQKLHLEDDLIIRVRVAWRLYFISAKVPLHKLACVLIEHLRRVSRYNGSWVNAPLWLTRAQLVLYLFVVKIS